MADGTADTTELRPEGREPAIVGSASGCVTVNEFSCPGTTQPVSAAVHLGRLMSGWSACHSCDFRHELGGLPESVREKIRADFRTPPDAVTFGAGTVRGRYLNALDRQTTALLALLAVSHSASAASADDETVCLKVVLGFDSRACSPDLFAGATDAVRLHGHDVISAGRATAASLLEVQRSERADLAMMITGAGCGEGTCGWDIFDQDGRPAAVPFHRLLGEFGITAAGEYSRQNLTAAAGEILRHVRVPRQVRSAGRLTSLNAEESYFNFVSRWIPRRELHQAVLIEHPPDSLISERFRRLETQCSGAVFEAVPMAAARRSDEVPERESLRRSGPHLILHEDDRLLTVLDSAGRLQTAIQIRDWLNTGLQTTASTVTAHVSSDGRAVELWDTARPDSGRSLEVVTDGLVLSLLTASLISQGHQL